MCYVLLSCLHIAVTPATSRHTAPCLRLSPPTHALPQGGLATWLLRAGNHTEPATHLFGFLVTLFRILVTTFKRFESHSPQFLPTTLPPTPPGIQWSREWVMWGNGVLFWMLLSSCWFHIRPRSLFNLKIILCGCHDHRDMWLLIAWVRLGDTLISPPSKPLVFLAHITHLTINHVLLWDICGFTFAIFFSSLFPTGQPTWHTKVTQVMCLCIFHRLYKLGLKTIYGLSCGSQVWAGCFTFTSPCSF